MKMDQSFCYTENFNIYFVKNDLGFKLIYVLIVLEICCILIVTLCRSLFVFRTFYNISIGNHQRVSNVIFICI